MAAEPVGRVETAAATDATGDGTVAAPQREAARRRLLELIAAGDRGALAALYEGDGGALFGYVLSLVGDPGVAEDVVQDTFLAAWRGARGYEGRASVRSWLFAIARRRAAERQRRPALRVLPLEDAHETPSPAPDPGDVAIAAVSAAEIAAAIARLRPIHREVLLLTFAHGLSYWELAEILGIPLGTVKSRLNHAKRALGALLDPGQVDHRAPRPEGGPQR